MSKQLDESARDYVGHGQARPLFDWPNGSRVAVSIVINYEEGSERSLALGDPFDDLTPGWDMSTNVPRGARNHERESYGEYGSRVGIWRVLGILERHSTPATIFACAEAFARNPAVARACVAAGHEIASHGERWEPHGQLTTHEERSRMERSSAALGELCGSPPLGWYSRDGIRPSSRSSLHGAGYTYDSNAFDDDVPYTLDVNGARHPVVPYTGDANDYRLLASPPVTTAAEFASYLVDSLELLLLESSEMSSVLSIGLHAPLIGRPAYAPALDRFLRACQNRPLWFARRAEIAAWWRDTDARSSTK